MKTLPPSLRRFLAASALPILLGMLIAVFLGGCASDAPRGTGFREATGGYKLPPSPSMAMSDSAAPKRRHERGLGTSWGEERDSSVSRTTFVRANAKNPAAVHTIHYNDREGIAAMKAHLSASRGGERAACFPDPSRLVTARLRSGSGRWLDTTTVGGFQLATGERGDRYDIVIRNKTRGRLEVVVSVDGLDVMDGRSASFTKRGYIVHGGDTLTVDGFRTGPGTVAAFRFGSVSRSYAALKHGDTRNVGVIGMAIFPERDSDTWRRKSANPFPNARWATAPE